MRFGRLLYHVAPVKAGLVAPAPQDLHGEFRNQHRSARGKWEPKGDLWAKRASWFAQQWLPVIAVLVAAGWLRFANLGH